MRLAMRIGALFYALSYAHSLRMGARSMRIAGASKGVGALRREEYQGGIGRRPVCRPSSSFLLPGQAIPGRGRVRGARAVAAFSMTPSLGPGGWKRPGSELRLRAQAGRGVGEGRAGSRRIWAPGRPSVRHTVSYEPCSAPRSALQHPIL